MLLNACKFPPISLRVKTLSGKSKRVTCISEATPSRLPENFWNTVPCMEYLLINISMDTP